MIVQVLTRRGAEDQVPAGAPAPRVALELAANERLIAFEISQRPQRRGRSTVDWSWQATIERRDA